MRRALVLAVIFASFAVPITRTSAVPRRLSCADFTNQTAAQAVLDADSTDPWGLDPDGNGIACDEATASPTVAASPAGEPVPDGIPAGSVKTKVEDHRDGGTFVATIDGKRKLIRLLAIEVPDAKVKPFGECYANEALARLKSVLPKETMVYLEADQTDHDDKGRLLRYVWIAGTDGKKPTLINQKMVRDGFAGATDGSKDTKYADRLKDAQKRAQDEARGIWKDCGGPHVKITATPTPELTEGQIKARFQPLDDVRELEARPAGMFGQKIVFYGTIYLIQEAPAGQAYVLGDSNPQQYRTFIGLNVVAPDGSSPPVVVGFNGDTKGMFEGTYVVVYGTVVDTATGTNAFGASVTNPLVSAQYVELA